MAYFYWDPSRYVFSWNLPLLERPILWYGVFFALGFFLAYTAFVYLLRHETQVEVNTNARRIADQITTYIIIGVILGARVFDVIFYEDISSFIHSPLKIFYIWEGGLSSHGGVIGLLLALLLYQRRQTYFTFYHLLDLLSIVSGIAAAFIRVGNFFNQEILGVPTTVPWAVVFGHPMDGSIPVPRHPVQLYEALTYLLLFVLMWKLKKYINKWKEGRLCGLFLMLVFTSRFALEFFKKEQSEFFVSQLKMGQWLSLPLIAFSIYLVLRRGRRHKLS
jgi:prolipoprotein diacylglyceryl transferase